MLLLFCRYWPYLSKVAEESPDLQPLVNMRQFLSVMHAKAHTAKCEVLEMKNNNAFHYTLTIRKYVKTLCYR